jgi:predicted nucleotidyltransferase
MKMTKKEKIIARLKEHWAVAAQRYNEDNFIGIFLYGSQNYGLDTEESDIDSILLYCPSFREIVLNCPISSEIHLENGEHIVIKDIREYTKQVKKQNISILEILFTEYFILNPKYVKVWNHYTWRKEEYARLNPQKMAISLVKQVKNTLKKDEISGKQLARCWFYFDFLAQYMLGMSYAQCLDCGNLQYLKDLKTGKMVEKAKPAYLKEKIKQWNALIPSIPKENKEIVDDLDNCLVILMSQSM